MFVTTIKFLLIYSLECKGVKFRIINPRMNQLPTLLYTCLSKDLNWKKREVLLECIHPPCWRSSDVEFFQIRKSHRCAGMSKILVGTNLCAGRNLTPPPHPPDWIRVNYHPRLVGTSPLVLISSNSPVSSTGDLRPHRLYEDHQISSWYSKKNRMSFFLQRTT